MWCVISVPFVVRNGEYSNGIGIIFCCYSSSVYGSFGFVIIMRVSISNSFSFVGEYMSNRSKYFVCREWRVKFLD